MAGKRTVLRLAQDEADGNLQQLERQLRLEGEKKDETAAVLRSQGIAIDKLSKDNKQLKDDMEIVQRDLAHTQQASAELRILQSKIEYYQSEIDSEKEHLAELDKLSSELDKKLHESRRRLNGARGADAGQAALQNSVNTLENRLETALREYNSELTVNGAQRQTIDHLRQERKFFDALSAKLGREIQELKKAMADVVEKSSEAYDSRTEALSKMAALRDKTDKEMAQYNTEIKEITRVLEHDRKLRSFMAIKGQERKDLSQTQTLSKTKKLLEQPDKEGSQEERLAALEHVFNEIMTQTGVTTLEQAVDRFIQGEASNFSAFKFVNESNNEIDLLQEKIAELQAKAEKTKNETADIQADREKTIAKNQEKMAASEKLVESLETSRESARQQLDSLAGAVEDLFNQIGCDRTSLGDSLGNDHVTRSNLKLFLSMIEHKTNELLQLRARLDARARQQWEQQEAELRDQAPTDTPFDPVATLGPKPVVASLLGTGPVSVPAASTLLPTTEYASDQEDFDDDAPLSMEEIKARLKSGLDSSQRQTVSKKNVSTMRVTKKR